MDNEPLGSPTDGDVDRVAANAKRALEVQLQAREPTPMPKLVECSVCKGRGTKPVGWGTDWFCVVSCSACYGYRYTSKSLLALAKWREEQSDG